MKKQEKGITLIALIITIVVLIILAVVAINEIEDGGILDKANETATLWNQKQEEEQTMLNEYEKKLKQELCSHEYDDNGVCTKCKYFPCEDGHTYVKGVCAICGHVQAVACQHDGETSIISVDENTHKIICLSCDEVISTESHSWPNYAGNEIDYFYETCQYCFETRECKFEYQWFAMVYDNAIHKKVGTCLTCGGIYVADECYDGARPEDCTICAQCKDGHTDINESGYCNICGIYVCEDGHNFVNGICTICKLDQCFVEGCSYNGEWTRVLGSSTHEYIEECIRCGSGGAVDSCYEGSRHDNCDICKYCKENGHTYDGNGECTRCGYCPCENGHSWTHYTDSGYREDEHQCEVCGVIVSANTYEEWYNTGDPAAHTSSLYCTECGLLEENYGTCSGNGEAYDDPDCLICAHCSGHYYESKDSESHQCSSCSSVAFHILNSQWYLEEDEYGVNYGTHYESHSCDVCGYTYANAHGAGAGPADCTLCNP